MSTQHWCPEYVEAVKREQLERSRAVIGSRESIGGIEVAQLTPYLFEVLSAHSSPFAVGGKVTCAAILQFLYIVRVGFDYSEIAGFEQWMAERLTDTDCMKAGEEISAYMERTFMDSEDGKHSKPFYSFSASLCASMCESFHWDIDRTLHTPIRFIFQLLRAKAKSEKANIINRVSDSVLQEAVELLQKKLKNGEVTQEQMDAINLRGREPKNG